MTSLQPPGSPGHTGRPPDRAVARATPTPRRRYQSLRTQRVDAVPESTITMNGGIKITYGCVSQRGHYPENPSKANQDAYFVHEDLCEGRGDALFGVCDGHGQDGDRCSLFVKRVLAEQICMQLSRLPANASAEDNNETFKAAAIQTNKLLRQNGEGIDDSMSGTTANWIVVQGHEMAVGNIGDSRTILGRVKFDENGEEYIEAQEITVDHKPDRRDERARIEANGARVLTEAQREYLDNDPHGWRSMEVLDFPTADDDDPHRVYQAKDAAWPGPGTAFSRSIGDSVAEELGVIAEPEVYAVQITPDVKYVVLCSDGITEWLENQDIVDIVSDPSHNGPLVAAKVAVDEAEEQWKLNMGDYADDMTILVLHINHPVSVADSIHSTENEAVAMPPLRSPKVTQQQGYLSSITKLFSRGTNEEDETVTLPPLTDNAHVVTAVSAEGLPSTGRTPHAKAVPVTNEEEYTEAATLRPLQKNATSNRSHLLVPGKHAPEVWTKEVYDLALCILQNGEAPQNETILNPKYVKKHYGSATLSTDEKIVVAKKDKKPVVYVEGKGKGNGKHCNRILADVYALFRPTLEVCTNEGSFGKLVGNLLWLNYKFVQEEFFDTQQPLLEAAFRAGTLEAEQLPLVMFAIEMKHEREAAEPETPPQSPPARGNFKEQLIASQQKMLSDMHANHAEESAAFRSLLMDKEDSTRKLLETKEENTRQLLEKKEENTREVLLAKEDSTKEIVQSFQTASEAFMMMAKATQAGNSLDVGGLEQAAGNLAAGIESKVSPEDSKPAAVESTSNKTKKVAPRATDDNEPTAKWLAQWLAPPEFLLKAHPNSEKTKTGGDKTFYPLGGTKVLSANESITWVSPHLNQDRERTKCKNCSKAIKKGNGWCTNHKKKWWNDNNNA